MSDNESTQLGEQDRLVIEILKQELAKRQGRNPRYSANSFARYLGLSASLLSQILSGRRSLTIKTAKAIVEKVPLTYDQVEAILAPFGVRNEPPSIQRLALTEQRFARMNTWIHMAILSLAELPECRWQPGWVAERLNIKVTSAWEAMKVLKQLGMVTVAGDSFSRSNTGISSGDGMPSAAIRAFHKDLLGKALETIELPTKHRVFKALTRSVCVADIPKVAQAIDRFLDDIAAITKTDNPEEVYATCVQFVPLSQPLSVHDSHESEGGEI